MPLLPLLQSGAPIHPKVFGARRSSLPFLLVINTSEYEAEPHKNIQSISVSTTNVGIDKAVARSSAAHFVGRAPGASFPKILILFLMVSLTIA